MPHDDQTTTELLSEPPRLVPGRVLDGDRYQLERRLGSGGMAVIWLARDRRLDRPVAIKVLSDTLATDPEYLSRFEREAHLAAQLSHPNLVPIYDFDIGERPYLVMEYIEGGTLNERIEQGTVPDPDQLASELLSALDHIHAAGIIHRDVKPRNVLVGVDGRARLTDFGIARPLDETSMTRTGLVLGTSPYLAPEVLAGGPSTERSDLYALGVTLAEASEADRAPAPLRALTARLRSQDPARRPPTAAAALRDLEDGVSASPRARPGPVGPPAALAERRVRMLAIVGPALLALAMLVIIIGAIGGGDGGGADSASRNQNGGKAAEKGEREATPEAGEGAISSEAPATGYELNDQGYALMQEGRYDEAIPLLERAVDALSGTGDINYAYALYNLGSSLRLAGRPDEAIPLLEERLEIPNQTGVVRKELELARAEAGYARAGEIDD